MVDQAITLAESRQYLMSLNQPINLGLTPSSMDIDDPVNQSLLARPSLLGLYRETLLAVTFPPFLSFGYEI